jgi:hypothetical protein
MCPQKVSYTPSSDGLIVVATNQKLSADIEGYDVAASRSTKHIN